MDQLSNSPNRQQARGNEVTERHDEREATAIEALCEGWDLETECLECSQGVATSEG